MQRLEDSGAVRLIYKSLGVKRLIYISCRMAEELQNDQLMTTCIDCNQEANVIAGPVDLVHCLVSLERHIDLDP